MVQLVGNALIVISFIVNWFKKKRDARKKEEKKREEEEEEQLNSPTIEEQ